MGKVGYLYAKKKFPAENNCGEVVEIYDQIVNKI